MITYDIGEVARQAALSAATLRFYEEQGLIQPSGRRGLRRVYAADVFERLALIQLGRAAGFSLGELSRMLNAARPIRIDKSVLAARAAALDAQIRELSLVREGLRHALCCKAPDLMSCPHFRRVLQRAARGRIPTPPAPSRRKRRAARPAQRRAALRTAGTRSL
jgi:DNA-binding transcriptional MerR regulator